MRTPGNIHLRINFVFAQNKKCTQSCFQLHVSIVLFDLMYYIIMIYIILYDTQNNFEFEESVEYFDNVSCFRMTRLAAERFIPEKQLI